MTVKDVLAQVRETAPGEYSDQRVMDLVRELDQRVWRELLDGYIVEEHGDELIVPTPYDAMYKWWALGNVALLQQDIGAYNNYIQMFNGVWDEYGRMVSSTYRREKDSRYRI